jgi:GxxExxY protein
VQVARKDAKAQRKTGVLLATFRKMILIVHDDFLNLKIRCMTENELSKIIVDCCFKIHSKLGPGLLESVYEEVLAYELRKHGLLYTRQEGVPVLYDEIKLDIGFRADIIVEDKIVIEIKSVETITPVHYKQVLTYLRLTGIKLGLLVNFNGALIKDGIKRIVNDL